MHTKLSWRLWETIREIIGRKPDQSIDRMQRHRAIKAGKYLVQRIYRNKKHS